MTSRDPQEKKPWGVYSASQNFIADDPLSRHTSAKAAQRRADKLTGETGEYHCAIRDRT